MKKNKYIGEKLYRDIGMPAILRILGFMYMKKNGLYVFWCLRNKAINKKMLMIVQYCL